MDQLFLDWLAVDRLDDLGGLLLAGRDDPLQHVVRIGVAREHAFEVQHGEAAQASHLDGQARAHHAVHGGGDDRSAVLVATQLPGDVDLIGIDGESARHERDIVETVRCPGLAPSPDPHSHVVPPGSPGVPRRGSYPKYRGRPADRSLDLVQYSGRPRGCQSSALRHRPRACVHRMRRPSSPRSSFTWSRERATPAMSRAFPPVAMTLGLPAISAFMRSTSPSTRPA